MARKQTAGPAPGRRSAVTAEQPPRTILLKGERVDVSHLTGDELFAALKLDEEQWDYKRLHAETGRSVVRLRVWVSNAYTAAKTSQAPDDKTFVKPDGHVGGSPWWRAGRAREELMKIGVMTREGVAIPYKPTGRRAGARNLGPRKSPENTAVRSTAEAVYGEYVKLTTRKRDPLSDREARAELCRKHGISRTQLARRINAGKEMAGVAGPAEVDVAALRARLAELVAEKRAAGYSESGADDRARTALAAEAGLTRRQLAGYLTAAAAEEKTG